MAKTVAESWALGDWMLRRYAERQYQELKNKRQEKAGIVYIMDDFNIRKKGDHWESYNTKTGETLFEGMTYEEAMADLREEFGS